MAAVFCAVAFVEPATAGFFSSSPSPIPPASVPGAAPVPAQYADPAQQMIRIDNLENSVRQLNGRIDELTHQIQVLQNLLQRAQEDNEFRFKQLEGGKPQKRSDAGPAAAPPAMTAPPAATADATPTYDQVADAAPAADGAMTPPLPQNGFAIDANAGPINDGGDNLIGAPPKPLGQLPVDAAGGPLDLSAIARGDSAPAAPLDGASATGVYSDAVATASAPVPAGATATATLPGQLPPPPTLAAPPASRTAPSTQVAALTPATAAADPRVSYEAAYAKVVAGDYAGAESGFKKFLADYPKDQLAGGAHYWLGETYYSRGQYRDAATSFLATYKDYPKNPKAPDSLLKLGMSLEALGETSAACATYGELTKKFPKAAPTLMTRVANQRTKLGCQ
jgi:tol-pal system protein YbgF